MKILLMRHGEAVDAAAGITDAERWLTAKGRRTTREAAALATKHIAPKTVWTSPLVRAVQTAEILVDAAELEDDVSVVREIASGNLGALRDMLQSHRGEGPIALVGHEPTLSSLAMMLLDEKRWPGFEKSAVCAITWGHDKVARFEWMLLPKKLRIVEDLQKLNGG